MQRSPFSKEELWPRENIFGTLFQYYSHAVNSKDLDAFRCRKDLIKRIKSDAEFFKFLKLVQERHPEKKEYLKSLINKNELFDSSWIRSEYCKYCKQIAFEKLTEEKRSALSKRLSDKKNQLYQEALKGEACRLNCNTSDLQRTCPVLALESGDRDKFKLVDLPHDVFLNIMRRLDTLDIFRMSLVSRQWKELVYKSAHVLKRVEHAFSTHLITFSGWIDGTRVGTAKDFESEYRVFSLGLMQWCLGISSCLETLILNHSVSHQSVRSIIQLCPKLKNLQIGFNLDNDSYERDPPDKYIPSVVLPNLECFISAGVFGWHVRDEPVPRINSDVLLSSNSLKVFAGSLDHEDVSLIDARCLSNNPYSQLIALELTWFGPCLLESLSNVESFQLKYFGLAIPFDNDGIEFKPGLSTIPVMRTYLSKILSKLTQLKVFVFALSHDWELQNCTIPILTKMNVKVEYTLIGGIRYTPEVGVGPGDDHNSTEEKEGEGPLNPRTLSKFRDMLLARKNPELDLSNFHFSLEDGEQERREALLENFKDTFPEFTVIDHSGTCSDIICKSKLNHPAMKRRLGIDF
eukprot:g7619.t1